MFFKSDLHFDNVEIIDLNGRKLASLKVENNKINLQNLNSGIYIIRINIKGNFITQKIIIE